MLVRRNSNEYNSLQNLIEVYKNKSSRSQLIKLYIVKAGHSLKDKIAIEGLKEGEEIFYNMTYDSIIGNFKEKEILLYRSEDNPNLYFFKNTNNKEWDQTPFEIDESLIKKLSSFKDLPQKSASKDEEIGNKTKKSTKIRTLENKLRISYKKNEEKVNHPEEDGKKETSIKEKVPEKLFNSTQYIPFTDLKKVLYPKINLTKEGVLEYYRAISGRILPHLINRPQSIKLQGNELVHSLESLRKVWKGDLPEWIETTEKYSQKEKKNKPYFIIKDYDHLLYLLEIGCIELHPWLTRAGILDCPDQLIINLIPKKSQFKHVIEIAQFLKRGLDTMKLPSFVKTSENRGLHIYIPLNGRKEFAMSRNLAQFLVKLIYSKMSAIATLQKSEPNKVYLDFSQNQSTGSIIVPYSMIEDSPIGEVITPLKWEEVKYGLNTEEFTIKGIFDRVEKVGDLFQNFSSDAIDSEITFEKLNGAYSFLL